MFAADHSVLTGQADRDVRADHVPRREISFPAAAPRGHLACSAVMPGPLNMHVRTFIPKAALHAPLPGERSKQPYGPAQIDGYLALADAQPTAERRMRAAGLVCLGAGAGLIRADLREVRGTDVAYRSGGVIVSVRGGRPRTMPVLARYHGRLLAAAASAGTGPICGGTDPGAGT